MQQLGAYFEHEPLPYSCCCCGWRHQALQVQVGPSVAHSTAPLFLADQRWPKHSSQHCTAVSCTNCPPAGSWCLLPPSRQDCYPAGNLTAAPAAPAAQVQELVYSPAHGPGVLAAGCCDMTIYLYNAKHEYQLIAK